jgi:group 2 glycosyl transferase
METNSMQIEDVKLIMVSIRCTVYNHEPYLRDCLEGFIMQKTNFRIEAIVHDDASTDGSATIIKEYAEKYPDIIKPIYEVENQYSKHNGSLERIMNEACKGKYIAFCEGDDYWIDPLKLQKQVDFLESNTDYSMSHTNNICYNQKKRIFVRDVGERKKEEIGNGLTCEDIIKYNRIVMTLTVVMRRSVYEQINNSDPFVFNSGNFLLGDVPKWYTAARLGKVHYLKDITSTYRVLENSASHIKGCKNRYKFAVSAQGLRVYLCRRDKLSSELSALTEKKYADVLLHHLVFNPQYKPIVPLLPNTYVFELFLQKRGMLGPYLIISDMYRKIKSKLLDEHN